MLAKFSRAEFERTYLSLEEQKDNTDFIKRECEIRKFHFAGVQRLQMFKREVDNIKRKFNYNIQRL